MRTMRADDIKADAIKVLHMFSDGIKDGMGNLISPPVEHFITILENDPSLKNIFFFREYDDGPAHRDPAHCFLRSSTDRDRELIKTGVELGILAMKDKSPLPADEEAEITHSIVAKFPPLSAYISADKYDYADDTTKAWILFHLLLHYDPIKIKTRKHDHQVFTDELQIFGRRILNTVVPQSRADGNTDIEKVVEDIEGDSEDSEDTNNTDNTDDTDDSAEPIEDDDGLDIENQKPTKPKVASDDDLDSF